MHPGIKSSPAVQSRRDDRLARGALRAAQSATMLPSGNQSAALPSNLTRTESLRLLTPNPNK
eukprot:3027359-Prymnesium_polylepis.1